MFEEEKEYKRTHASNATDEKKITASISLYHYSRGAVIENLLHCLDKLPEEVN